MEETLIFGSDNSSASDSENSSSQRVKFSVHLPPHPSAKPNSRSAGSEQPEDNLQYVTEFVANNPPAQTFKIIPKLDNSWRLPTMTDAHLNFEAGVQPAEFKPETQIQLNSPIISEIDDFMSNEEVEKRKLREYLERLPDEPSPEAYESMPVLEFGEALLRGMGWSYGKGIGLNAKGPVVPYQRHIRRVARMGLGASLPVDKKT